MNDAFELITQQIIEALENGNPVWKSPWQRNGVSSLPLRWNGDPYQGVNVISLWGRSWKMGYSSPYWMTFKQAQSLGGSVKKGEKGSRVVYAKEIFAKDDGAESSSESGEKKNRRFFLKTYYVFNADQIEDLPEEFYGNAFEEEEKERIPEIENFFSKIDADVRHGGDKAYYHPDLDYIQMPNFDAFRSSDHYYATLSHELIHWTGHESRLDRHQSFAKDITERAMEEIVAEIGSAFLCAELGLRSDEQSENNAAYVRSWLKLLKNDKRFIFRASSMAQKAVDYINDMANGCFMDYDSIEAISATRK